MRTIFRLRSVALIATIAMMGATAFVASGATGAYFSATETGTIDATIGSIELGTSNLDFTFEDLLPGDERSATITFTNEGDSSQDIYLVLDSSAVGAMAYLSSLGTVTIIRGDLTPLFDSTTDTWPTTGALPIRSNVGSGGWGTFTATFTINPSVDESTLTPSSSTTITYEIVATQVGILPGAIGTP